MRKIILGALALSAATIGTAASAASIVGAPSVGPYPSIYFNYTANVGGQFGNNDPTLYPPHFSDTYTFSTGFARNATVEITSSYPISPRADFSKNVNFISNGVKLNAKIIPILSAGVNERRYLANFRIPAGVQNIFVNGSAGVNGVYAGILTLSGVPEPTSWALMITGFGFVGGAMRRRRSAGSLATA